jgi:hypothetical protein
MGDAAALGVKMEGRGASDGDAAAIGPGVGLTASGAAVGVASTGGGLGRGKTEETWD